MFAPGCYWEPRLFVAFLLKNPGVIKIWPHRLQSRILIRTRMQVAIQQILKRQKMQCKFPTPCRLQVYMIINNYHQDKGEKAMKSNSAVRNLLIQVVKLVPFHCQREAIYLLPVVQLQSHLLLKVFQQADVDLQLWALHSKSVSKKGIRISSTDSIIDKVEICKQLQK